MVGERKVYQVSCDAALLDLRKLWRKFPLLVHPADYGYTQSVGRRIQREGHPGLVSRSARWVQGECYAIFNAGLLSEPRQFGALTYRLGKDSIAIESQPGKVWLSIPLDSWQSAAQAPAA